MSEKELHEYLLSFPNAWLDYPFGEDVAVYKIGQAPGKMFALIGERTKPLQLSLKCDPVLAEKLRDQYESVLPGYHLNKKHWNTVIVNGELENRMLLKFIKDSYKLVGKKKK